MGGPRWNLGGAGGPGRHCHFSLHGKVRLRDGSAKTPTLVDRRFSLFSSQIGGTRTSSSPRLTAPPAVRDEMGGGYGAFPRTAQADAVSDRGPSREPEQYASRTASLIRAFRPGDRLAK